MSRENERERIRQHLIQSAGGCLREVVQAGEGWEVSISDPVHKVDAAWLPFAETPGFDTMLADVASGIAGMARWGRDKWH